MSGDGKPAPTRDSTRAASCDMNRNWWRCRSFQERSEFLDSLKQAGHVLPDLSVGERQKSPDQV